jgi:hypothetical protein
MWLILTSKYPQLCLETVNNFVEPETVSRKGLQAKSLEASPALKKLEVWGLKRPC